MNPSRYVVVPHQMGPLIRLETTANDDHRDELDNLVDELFPDIDERPGWFDAGLAVVGAALVAWAWFGSAPAIVTVLGVIALLLGCILPLRSAWRRARQRRHRRHREELLQRGVPLDTSSAATAALIAAYDELLDIVRKNSSQPRDAVISAAHSALLEVASLLEGRAPNTDRQIDYVDKRRAAIAELGVVLQRALSSRVDASDAPRVHPDALVEAREELDRIAPLNAVTRLEALIAETEIRHRDDS